MAKITASIEIRGTRNEVVELLEGNLDHIPQLNDYVVVSRGGKQEKYVVRGVSHVISCGADDAPTLVTRQGVVVTVGRSFAR